MIITFPSLPPRFFNHLPLSVRPSVRVLKVCQPASVSEPFSRAHVCGGIRLLFAVPGPDPVPLALPPYLQFARSRHLVNLCFAAALLILALVPFASRGIISIRFAGILSFSVCDSRKALSPAVSSSHGPGQPALGGGSVYLWRRCGGCSFVRNPFRGRSGSGR